jgi:hypothetical protein
MYHLTGAGGAITNLTLRTCQKHLKDLQSCVQACYTAGYASSSLRALAHSLTGTYAHMTNDWTSAQHHYSTALDACAGTHSPAPC